VGRPDLAVSSDISSADLAGMLFDSVKKIKALDKNLRIYPGHGSGSACGKSIGAGNFCTLAIQH
jgi:glyoxylase-like metal-dependent hydrolase (beta-lactamase superfamily II)